MKAVFSDIDGTFTLEPSWKALAIHYGYEREDYEGVKRYLKREITHDDLVLETVARLRKVCATSNGIIQAIKGVQRTPGLEIFLQRLNGNGAAVISGGVYDCLEVLGIKSSFREHHMPKMLYDDEGKITGVKLFDGSAQGKIAAFEEVRTRMGLRYEDCVYLGDSANDLLIAEALARNRGVFILVDAKNEEMQKMSSREDDERLKTAATAVIHNLEDALSYII
ncbi:haloacid dehalogenase-like hydrolase [Candidatus Woesearchaeota archaeon]|nr:haloacid dehalogenase-like hydrolase [Candidatus Woesearchaeota archaeon]